MRSRAAGEDAGPGATSNRRPRARRLSLPYGLAVPVEFLSDEEAAQFGRYNGPPSRSEMEKLFFLDDADKEEVAKRRGAHNRLGFALQLTTVRYLGTFLADPLDVPAEVVDYLSQQLGVADPSCVKRYTRRAKTPLEHTWAIRERYHLREFAEAEADLEAWAYARAWTTGDGPKAIFNDAVEWLGEYGVLLPGVTRLARLVAAVRDEATRRLWGTLSGLLSPVQARVLDGVVVVPEGARACELERWRKGPTRTSGPGMVKALERISEVKALGTGPLDLGAVPRRRLVELARYGMGADAALLRRHPSPRRLATLLATVAWLESKATDDALELLDVLMTSELVGRAEREADKEKLRRHDRLAEASAKLAAAMEVLLDAATGGDEVDLAGAWQAVDALVPRAELRAALSTVVELAPAPSPADAVAEWRVELSRRFATVSSFLKLLTKVVDFGADAEAAAVLAAMRAVPALLDGRRRPTVDDIELDVVTGPWRDLVLGRPRLAGGAIDKAAYVFCVLTQFHRHLKRHGIYAPGSTRWADPRAALLDGQAWARAKDPVLTALGLPDDPGDLLAGHATALDEAYRQVRDGLVAGGSDVTVDKDGRLHVASLKAVPEPESLLDLRKAVQAMLPRADLPEVVLEVMAWEPGFIEAFAASSGGAARMAGLDVSVTACLSAQAMNVGYQPIARRGVPALARDRLSHVAQTYFCAENLASANAPLVARQAQVPFAQSLGGGLVAAVDGMRFVVPVPSVYARANRKYFGTKKGVTWLNMINDQAAGLAAKVVSGTVRDSLYVIDVIYSQDGGQRPDIVVTDTASYSDLVFGLLQLLGFQYRPALADIPDQRLWRINSHASYGPLDVAARGRIDLDRIRKNWPDILRVVGSIHTGAVRAYDIVRMLQRDGHPTPLGEAIASYGRIFKSLHVLALIDDEAYRRDIKGIRNLQEGRHDLAQKIFHGRKGELYQRYHDGMEDQLGALGLVLNCIVLWNTVYIDATLGRLRASGHPVQDEDVARLSPFMRKHLNVLGAYSFALPEMPGGLRELGDPATPDDEDD